MTDTSALIAVVFRHRNALRANDVDALRRHPAVQLSTDKLRGASVCIAVAVEPRPDGAVCVVVRGSIPLERRVAYAGFEKDRTGSHRDLVEGPVWDGLIRRLDDEAPPT